MQKIVDELLQAEAEAKSIVQAAQTEVQSMKTKTEAECSDKIAHAREESRLLIQKEIGEFKNESSNRLREEIERAETENRKLWESRQDQILSLTQQVVGTVIVPEYEKD